MTTSHELVLPLYNNGVTPNNHDERAELLHSLSGRSADEVRGIIQMLFANRQAHTDPLVLEAMQGVQASGDGTTPNTVAAVEDLVLDYLNHPEHQDSGASASGGGVSGQPPAA